jgi:heptaprenyl diphosphate synthase
MSVAFSLSGGIAAILIMILVRNILSEKNIVAMSISGAVFHNLSQIIVAVCIYGTFSAFYYIPSLFIAGVVCGILTGLCVKLIVKANIINKI